MPSGMKGLTSFVSDIRNCASKDAEKKRVEKEMAKIRQKFTDPSLSGYDRKKYVWKLLYAYMLGYDVDFGHMQAVNLCSSIKYSEKVAGYLACSLLLSDSPDILRLIINVCKSDLLSENDHIAALALHTVANIGMPEFSENLFVDVSRLFVSANTCRSYVRKKAALCLLRMHRRDPELLVPEEWCGRISEALSTVTTKGSIRDLLGFYTSLSSLLIGVLESNIHPRSAWIDCLRPVIILLSSLVTGECPGGYTYYSVPAPWLQVKLLRIIQYFPIDVISDDAIVFRINEILGRILGLYGGATTDSVPVAAPSGGNTSSSSITADDGADMVGSSRSSPQPPTGPPTGRSNNERFVNKSNAENSILFEAINVVIHLDEKIDREVRRSAARVLGKFVGAREANTRYLGLEAMARLANNGLRKSDDITTQANEHKLFDKYKSVIASQLHEPDVSIRKQALNLLYVICDKGNWEGIVDELLAVLGARYDTILEEELVLKIAILAEANAPDPTWYVDVVFKMFEYACESIGDEISDRLVQVVAGADESVGRHAAWKAYEALGGTKISETGISDNMLRICVYLIGEFGHYLVIARKVSSLRLVELVRKHFPRMTSRCKGIALTAYAKILNISPNNTALRDEVVMHIQSIKDSIDPDIQQRACELLFLVSLTNGDGSAGTSQILDKVLAMIPPPESDLKNPLVARLKMQTTRTRAATRRALEVAAESAGSMYKPSHAMVMNPNVAKDDESSGSSSSSGGDTSSDNDD